MNPEVDLKSIAGIAVVVLAVVEGIKRAIAGKKLDVVPVFVWVIIVSAAASGIAHLANLISVPWETAAAQVVISALTASGTFSWFANGTNTMDGTPAPSLKKMRTLAIAMAMTVVAFQSVGCVDPLQAKEKLFYQGVKDAWGPIKKDWAPRVNAAPELTPQEKLNRVGPKNSLAADFDALLDARGKDLSNAGN